MATIIGTANDDILNGTNGDDSISGLGGNDRLISNGGVDTLNGGAGTDTAVVDASALSGAISGGVPYGGLWLGSSQLVSLSSLEALEFKGNATGTYYSGVTGGSGNDILIGLDGNDRFDGGRGNNTIDGGGGSDVASFDFSDRTGKVEFVNGGVAGETYTALVGGVASGTVSNVEVMGVTGGGW